MNDNGSANCDVKTDNNEIETLLKEKEERAFKFKGICTYSLAKLLWRTIANLIETEYIYVLSMRKHRDLFYSKLATYFVLYIDKLWLFICIE